LMNVGTIQMMIFWSIIFLIKIEAYASFNRQNQEEIDRIGKGNFILFIKSCSESFENSFE